eukprot:4945063-Pyramimonas_sp.AAC.1
MRFHCSKSPCPGPQRSSGEFSCPRAPRVRWRTLGQARARSSDNPIGPAQPVGLFTRAIKMSQSWKTR